VGSVEMIHNKPRPSRQIYTYTLGPTKTCLQFRIITYHLMQLMPMSRITELTNTAMIMTTMLDIADTNYTHANQSWRILYVHCVQLTSISSNNND